MTTKSSLSRSRRLGGGLALLLGASLLSTGAHAALGEPYVSIAADQAALRAAHTASARPNYEIHELTLQTGTLVREYVAAGGTVFAIAWSGPYMPDLRQTLGAYFSDYVAAAQSGRGGRNHLTLERSDLVIQAGGRMRAFSGRAYLVNALPAGITTDEIR